MVYKYMENKNNLIKTINENYEYLKNIDSSHFTQCIGTIRTTLELAVKLFWLEKIGKIPIIEHNGKEIFNLYEATDDIRFKKYFNNFIYSDIHTIRKVCNQALHDGIVVSDNEIQIIIERLFNCIYEIEHIINLKIVNKPEQKIIMPQSLLNQHLSYDNTKSSIIINTLQEKIIAHNGQALMPTLKGHPIPFHLSSGKDGVESDGLRGVVLKWEIFDAIVKKAVSLGGKMFRGDSAAQNGARIGSDELSLDTIDGFISTKFYGAKIGDTTLRRSTYYSGILAWANIVVNHRSQGNGGFITVNTEFMQINNNNS